jgi:DNA-binding CsgD family transcriptional regulator
MQPEMQLLQTLDALRRAPDDASVLSSLTDFTSQFGLNFIYIAQFINPEAPLPAKWVSANNWPKALLESRARSKAYLHDPVIRMGLHAHCPFNWEDARAISGELGRKVLDEASTFGLKCGMMFPIRMIDLPPGGVSLGGVNINASRRENGLLEMAAREAYLRLMEIAGPKNWHTTGKLSRRESQILTMVAEGKNNQTVADELGIQADTVKDTLKRCYRKLGVSNRSAAVKQALMTLQILPLPTFRPPPNG